MNIDLMKCKKTEIYCFGEIVEDVEIALNVDFYPPRHPTQKEQYEQEQQQEQTTETLTGLENNRVRPTEYTSESVHIGRDESDEVIYVNHLLFPAPTELKKKNAMMKRQDSWKVEPDESGTDFNFVKIEESANLLIISWQRVNEDGIVKGQTRKMCFPFYRIQKIRINTEAEE